MTEKIPQRFNIVETMAPVQRKYLDRLIRELEEIAGGRSKEEIFASRDLKLVRSYTDKVLEISSFIKYREIKSSEFGREFLINWLMSEVGDPQPEYSVDNGFDLREWPKIKSLRGDIDLSDTNMSFVPPGLVVNCIDVSNCNKLTELPDFIEIKNTLRASNSGLKKLPRGLNLVVLDIIDCKAIEELPADIKISEELWMDKSSLKNLPAGLKLLGLAASDCPNLEDLPDDLQVEQINVMGCSDKVKQKARELKERGQIKLVVE